MCVATCDDISDTLEIRLYLFRPRVTKLEKLGKLFVLPEKRLGQLGHKVTVYSVVKSEQYFKTA